MKFSSRFLIAGMSVLLFSSGLFAQDKNGTTVDQIDSKPETRKTASMALPYGLIFTGGYPVVAGANPDGGFMDKFMGGIDFYYDAWLAGLHQTEHGDMFRFGPRSLGRELYGTWYFEVGTRGFKYQTIKFNSGKSDTTINSASSTILAFGFGNRTNYTNLSSVGLIGGYNVTFGTASGYSSSFLIIEAEYDIGLRIPMDKNALSVYLRIGGGFGLPPTTKIVEHGGDPNGFGTINLTLQYALNFDKY